MTRALITGGAGFIGSHLAEELLRRGQSVTIVDDLSCGSMDNVAHISDNPNFKSAIGDIQDGELIGRLMDDCDVVYHLAACVGMRMVVDESLRTLLTNVRGTETILAEASKRNKKVLITSTSEVYGLNEKKPSSELDNIVIGATTKPRWNYACSKAIDEFLAFAYMKEKGTPVVVARLFNTVGLRQSARYGMVLPNFVKRALAGEPITVYGDGTQTRCFCNVSEVVVALATLMERKDAEGDVYNVGSNEETRIIDLATRIKAMTNSTSEITFTPHEEIFGKGFDEIERRIPDITKVKTLIGFDPKTKLDEILAQMVEFYKAEMLTTA